MNRSIRNGFWSLTRNTNSKKGANLMVNRDQNGGYITASEWIRMGIDKGISSESLLHALEAQMTKKQARPQESGSLASGDLAVMRCHQFQNWYRKLGFNLSIPFPLVSDEEYKRRQALGQALFYRPSSAEVSYGAFMKAVGQSKHWTVIGESARKEITWEPISIGYWFWAEVAKDCPRLKTSWKVLVKKEKLNLLSVEEYVIVWWAHKADTTILLDRGTWSWLRTRLGRSALSALGYSDRLDVDWWIVPTLSQSCNDGGGRVAEAVKT